MAFNWDKLVKAQRDFPKPKFALDNISRHLKKRPSDPYVLVSEYTNHSRIDEGVLIFLQGMESLCLAPDGQGWGR